MKFICQCLRYTHVEVCLASTAATGIEGIKWRLSSPDKTIVPTRSSVKSRRRLMIQTLKVIWKKAVSPLCSQSVGKSRRQRSVGTPVGMQRARKFRHYRCKTEIQTSFSTKLVLGLRALSFLYINRAIYIYLHGECRISLNCISCHVIYELDGTLSSYVRQCTVKLMAQCRYRRSASTFSRAAL